jgi:hypothetical protein
MKKNSAVSDYMKKLKSPLKAEMEAVREIILSADDRITESIKWSAPSFFYKDNMCTFNPRATKAVTLVFHKGAIIKDDNGLLLGDAKEARTAKFKDMDDIKANAAKLKKVVKSWIKEMDKKTV